MNNRTELKFWMPLGKPKMARVYVHGTWRDIYFYLDKAGNLAIGTKKKTAQTFKDQSCAESVLKEHRLFRSWDDPELPALVFLYAQAPAPIQEQARNYGITYVSAVPGAPPAFKLENGDLIDLPGRWPLDCDNPYKAVI